MSPVRDSTFNDAWNGSKFSLSLEELWRCVCARVQYSNKEREGERKIPREMSTMDNYNGHSSALKKQ